MSHGLTLLFQLRSSLENNPRLKAAADEMKKAGLKISDGVAEAMKAVEESELMRNVSFRSPCCRCL